MPFALYHIVSCFRGGGCNPLKNHSNSFSLQSLESSQDKWNDASHCIARHCNFSSAGNAPEMKFLHDPQANSIQGAKSQHDHRCGHGGFAIRDLYQITSHTCRLFTKGASQLSREEKIIYYQNYKPNGKRQTKQIGSVCAGKKTPKTSLSSERYRLKETFSATCCQDAHICIEGHILPPSCSFPSTKGISK